MPALYRALHSKGHTAAAGHLLCGISCLLVYVVTPGGLAFWVLMFCAAAFMGTFSSAQYSMLGDAVDYGEWKVGLRCDGFLSSFTSLALKTGSAIGPALGLYLINACTMCPTRCNPRSHHDDEGQYLPDPRDHSSGLRPP